MRTVKVLSKQRRWCATKGTIISRVHSEPQVKRQFEHPLTSL